MYEIAVDALAVIRGGGQFKKCHLSRENNPQQWLYSRERRRRRRRSKPTAFGRGHEPAMYVRKGSTCPSLNTRWRVVFPASGVRGRFLTRMIMMHVLVIQQHAMRKRAVPEYLDRT